jgi:hypothetical protein
MRVTHCLVCACALPVDPRGRRKPGRRRLYCGGICKQRAYRYRADEELAAILDALASGRLQMGRGQ